MTGKSKRETLRVLFIDDNDDMRSMMAILLHRQGYAVKTADCAPVAQELAPVWQPHLIVSDIGMPGTDGYELMRILRSDSRLAPFRAVALSGFGHMVEGDKGRLAGFDECLVKPIEFDKFFGVLKSLEATLSTEALTREESPLQNISDSDFDRNRSGSC